MSHKIPIFNNCAPRPDSEICHSGEKRKLGVVDLYSQINCALALCTPVALLAFGLLGSVTSLALRGHTTQLRYVHENPHGKFWCVLERRNNSCVSLNRSWKIEAGESEGRFTQPNDNQMLNLTVLKLSNIVKHIETTPDVLKPD